MYTRDEYNAELLKLAHRVADMQPAGRRAWPLLTPVEMAELAIQQGWAPANVDELVDDVRAALLGYVGESELPEAPDRV